MRTGRVTVEVNNDTRESRLTSPWLRSTSFLISASKSKWPDCCCNSSRWLVLQQGEKVKERRGVAEVLFFLLVSEGGIVNCIKCVFPKKKKKKGMEEKSHQ